MSNDHSAAVDHHSETIGPKARTRLWMVFWILLFVTIFEVALAFVPFFHEHHDFLINIYVALTVVKAYYIVFFFMHMKHENINMKSSILVPFCFLIAYFIYMMMTEGNALNWIRTVFEPNI